MSHASVVVALDKAKVESDGLEEALAWEMEPFDEGSEWFRDGSRWDWYVIGGRYTGNFDGYDPETDPDNQEVCDLCSGTGTRPDMQVANGCNRCAGEGMRLKWPTQWKKHNGDVVEVSALDQTKFTSAYAFLSNRHWHEAERMGWFGTPAYTECERKDMDKPTADPDKWFGKCLHKDEVTGARIICWNEPREIWNQEFLRRFIKPLPTGTILVNVDYHV